MGSSTFTFSKIPFSNTNKGKASNPMVFDISVLELD
jgi:hypothetical protein